MSCLPGPPLRNGPGPQQVGTMSDIHPELSGAPKTRRCVRVSWRCGRWLQTSDRHSTSLPMLMHTRTIDGLAGSCLSSGGPTCQQHLPPSHLKLFLWTVTSSAILSFHQRFPMADLQGNCISSLFWEAKSPPPPPILGAFIFGTWADLCTTPFPICLRMSTWYTWRREGLGLRCPAGT